MQTPADTTWPEANQAYLDKQLDLLRLRLRRRVLWLRTRWRHDPLQPYQGLVVSDVQVDDLLGGEDRQAEVRFYREDEAAAAVSGDLASAAKELERWTQDLDPSPGPPGLEVLARTFGLAPFERDALLLSAATELDASFERLFAYVQDDAARKFATPHLALALLAEEDALATARDAFLPAAPLRRFCLLGAAPGPSPETPASLCPLRVDDRVLDYLRGVNRIDQRIAMLLDPLPPTLLDPVHRQLADLLTASLQSDFEAGQWPLVNLVGSHRSGKRTVARAICRDLQMEVLAVDHRRLPSSRDLWQESLRLLERDAALLSAAVYVDASRPGSDEQRASAVLGDITRSLEAPVILSSDQKWQTDRETLVVAVPRLESSAQEFLWRHALDGVENSVDGLVDDIVQQFDFGPEAIVQIVTAARGKARLRTVGGPAVTHDDLWQACREQSGWRLEDLAQRIVPCHAWDDIVLPDDVMRQLREIAAQVAHRSQVYDGWEFGARLSRGRGISALFSGPSGTGKTMAAEILAGGLRLDLYRIDLAGVVSKYIGETEKNLRQVFDAAEESGAVLLFDEADALFGKRTEVKDSHDRYANIEVNYLLQRMEDYRGLAVLATNRKSDLDTAFLRRLRFLVDFPFPGAVHRRQIWEKVFPARAPLDPLDYDALARMEIPGGNIKNVSLNAAFLAADNGGAIGMSEVMHAARREYAKIDKLTSEAEFGSHKRKRNRRR